MLQDPPRLGNQYTEDSYLQAVLQRLLGADVLKQVQPDLTRFGKSEQATEHGSIEASECIDGASRSVLTRMNGWCASRLLVIQSLRHGSG